MDNPTYPSSTQTRHVNEQVHGIPCLGPGGVDMSALCVRPSAEGSRTPGRRPGSQFESSKAPCSSLPGIREELGAILMNGDDRSGTTAPSPDSTAPRDDCGPAVQRATSCVVAELSSIWPVPAAAGGFFLAVGVLGHVAWVQVLPGAQAIWVMR
jgi:hypothetical protein